MNSAVLGKAAANVQRYCQTRILCEKYGMALPAVLATAPEDDLLADAT